VLGRATVPRLRWPQELNGVRLDGAKAFFWKHRLFVVARKHILGPGIRKRTALYEITGHLDGGPIGIVEWGELPSAGDTAYAGVVAIGVTGSWSAGTRVTSRRIRTGSSA
jgi:hypothetical protein